MSTSRSRPVSIVRQGSSERGNRLSKAMSPQRTGSPSNPNRRVAKLNLYLQRARQGSSDHLHPIASEIKPNSPRNTDIKRWDGNRRVTIKWDSMRRDPELWFSSGDCLIHFYERGQSRRGASLRVSLEDIQSSNCSLLLDRYLTYPLPDTPPSSSDTDRQVDTTEDFNDPASNAKYEMYIPAPDDLSREEAFRYHLTTRNFFAWMFERPLVGERLGEALVALLRRMDELRPNPEVNQDDMLAYLDEQGYTDFRECPDHALGVLQYAEKCQDRDLWTDAFVHCAGMWDLLDRSAEFEHISRTTRALMSRAHLEMDLRLERAGSSLGNFLEDDLSGTYLGLAREAHLHLERFRTFLHTFYVGKHGYWPPTPLNRTSSALPKAVYRSMYFEFRNLYEYLVDHSSGVEIQNNKPVDGGICVYQNVVAYDRRHKYSPLPHPLPLVPTVPPQLTHRKSFGRLFAHKQNKLDKRIATSAALRKATNSYDDDVMSCELVREYLRFEKQWTMKEESSVSSADARKVRWILVYAILQTLISVTRAPPEVRDTEGVAYPLCCQIAGTPPWQEGETKAKKAKSQPTSKRASLGERILAIGPDMDILSAKPNPSVLTAKTSKKVSLPRKISINNSLYVKSPQPIKPSSWEMLNNALAEVSPIDNDNGGPLQLPSTSVSPIQHKNVSPLSQTAESDPTTPSSSEAGTGNGAWSASSSEDDMDHASVTGSDSNYGDDEDDDSPHLSERTLKVPTSKRTSFSSFRPGSHNPEVDEYILS